MPEVGHIYPTFEGKVLSALSEETPASSSVAGSLAAAAVAESAHDKRESHLMTLLACLAQMGLSVQERERTILLHMCKLWRSRPSARPLISLVYSQLSACLHYPTRTALTSSSSALHAVQLRARSSTLFSSGSGSSLLDDHLDFILCEWLVANSPIDDFPRELLMSHAIEAGGSPAGSAPSTPSLDSFLRSYAARLAPIVVIHHDSMTSTMRQLLDAVGCDAAALLKKYFAVCCARFYAIYSQNSNDDPDQTAAFLQAATSCLKFFKDTLGERKSADTVKRRNLLRFSSASLLFTHSLDSSLSLFCHFQVQHLLPQQAERDSVCSRRSGADRSDRPSTQQLLAHQLRHLAISVG